MLYNLFTIVVNGKLQGSWILLLPTVSAVKKYKKYHFYRKIYIKEMCKFWFKHWLWNRMVEARRDQLIIGNIWKAYYQNQVKYDLRNLEKV